MGTNTATQLTTSPTSGTCFVRERILVDRQPTLLGTVSCIVPDPLLMNDHRGDSPYTMRLNQFQLPPVKLLVLQYLRSSQSPPLLWWCILVCWPVSLFVNDLANLSWQSLLAQLSWCLLMSPCFPNHLPTWSVRLLLPFYSDDSPLDIHWGWLCSIHVYFLYVHSQ